MNLEESELEGIKVEKLPVLNNKSLDTINPCITNFFKEEIICENILGRLKESMYLCNEDQKTKNEIFNAFGTLISLRKDVNEKLYYFLEHISGRD